MILKRTPKKLLREPQRKPKRNSGKPKEIPKKPKEIPENSRETKVGNGYYQKKQEMFRAADISCFFEICYFCLGEWYCFE